MTSLVKQLVASPFPEGTTRHRAYENFAYIFEGRLTGFGGNYDAKQIAFMLCKGKVAKNPEVLRLAFDKVADELIKAIKETG